MMAATKGNTTGDPFQYYNPDGRALSAGTGVYGNTGAGRGGSGEWIGNGGFQSTEDWYRSQTIPGDTREETIERLGREKGMRQYRSRMAATIPGGGGGGGNTSAEQGQAEGRNQLAAFMNGGVIGQMSNQSGTVSNMGQSKNWTDLDQYMMNRQRGSMGNSVGGGVGGGFGGEQQYVEPGYQNQENPYSPDVRNFLNQMVSQRTRR